MGSLVSTSNPNGGILNTIGSLGVFTTSSMGFDILSDGLGGNTFYALLTSATGTPAFYTVNPATGAATLVGAINATRPYSLAIAPNSSVPDSGSSAALLVLALVGVTLIRRRLKVAAK